MSKLTARPLIRLILLCAAILTLAMTGLITVARWDDDAERYFLTYTAVGGIERLYRINPDGSGKAAIIGALFRIGSARWSPREMALTYLIDVGGSQIFINQTRWDGAANQFLTLRNVALINVSWSPDGSHLLVENGVESLNEMTLHQVSVINGTTTLLRDAVGSGAIYSPDGSQIAYHSLRTGAYQIYVMPADGSAERLLTGNSFGDYVLGWSPDGLRILFLRTFMRDFGALYDMRPDGTDLRRLTPEGATAQPEQATYSPDGKWIAFTQSTLGKFDIYIIPAEGGDAVQLTGDENNEMQPAWSPDSQWIAYVSSGDGNSDIYRMRPDGRDVQQLTNDPGIEQLPVWSPVYGVDWEPGLAIAVAAGMLVALGWSRR